MKNVLYSLLALALMAACVPLKQYQSLEAENETLKAEANKTSRENNSLSVQNKELSAKLKRMSDKVSALEKETASLDKELRRLQQRYNDMNTRYSEALQNLKNASSNDVDNRRLLEHLQALQNDLQKREDELIAAEQALDDKKESLEKARSELSQAQATLDAQKKRLIELEQLLTQKDDAMQNLKRTISDALIGFADDELQVHTKDGKLYVSLEEKLLFQSGRYEVNQQGVNALKKIAGVLERHTDIDILVEGHTDKVPYNGQGALKDNWDLSVKRATSVVRILLNNSQIDASRVIAAGRSEYLPLMTGNDAMALQKNRRTEIILTPRWVEVFEILNVKP
ncbi:MULTISPECIES: OmpA family protein [unclassified Carboxylicivirga]|uniref:OmpA family protein n=1 Tax=Carboxylicivirga TaxID=1628153 RepID=UPI003D33B99D